MCVCIYHIYITIIHNSTNTHKQFNDDSDNTNDNDTNDINRRTSCEGPRGPPDRSAERGVSRRTFKRAGRRVPTAIYLFYIFYLAI